MRIRAIFASFFLREAANPATCSHLMSKYHRCANCSIPIAAYSSL